MIGVRVNSIIFLDIDGVLNSARFEYVRQRVGKGSLRLDPSALALLAELVERTQAKLVITSSWRKERNPADFDNIFAAVLCSWKSSVIGKTPVADCRGEEIALWLAHNKVDCYAILDDLARNNFYKEQWQHLVKVDNRDGLLLKDIEQAARILEATTTFLHECGKPRWRIK